MAIQIEFLSFSGKVGWRIKDEVEKNKNNLEQIEAKDGNESHVQKSKNEGEMTEKDLENQTEILKQVKKLLDTYPREFKEGEADDINVRKVIE